MCSLLESFVESNTLDDLATVMERRIKGYGFSGYVYWTHLRVPIEALSSENTFVVSRGPAFLKAFEALYFRQKLYVDDPIVQIASQSTVPFSTKEIRSQTVRNTKRLRWLYALERRFDFGNDIYIPIHTPVRVQVFNAYCLGKSTLCPAGINELLPALTVDVAQFANSVADFVVMRGVDELNHLVFTVREQECLAWMAKGRSNGDIAKILNISERTIKFHVKNIMNKLGADNRTHAIAIAARSGWIPN